MFTLEQHEQSLWRDRAQHRRLVVALALHGQILGCTSRVCRDVLGVPVTDRPLAQMNDAYRIHLETLRSAT
jgi:hypothetical protein